MNKARTYGALMLLVMLMTDVLLYGQSGLEYAAATVSLYVFTHMVAYAHGYRMSLELTGGLALVQLACGVGVAYSIGWDFLWIMLTNVAVGLAMWPIAKPFMLEAITEELETKLDKAGL